MSTWETFFGLGREPRWFDIFESDPEVAIDDLLTGTSAVGVLGVVEGDELLLDWLWRIGDARGFRGRVDSALAAWIRQGWDDLPLTSGGVAGRLLASAWVRCCNVVSADWLPASASELHTKFPMARRHLGLMVFGPHLDPLAAFVSAIASWQKDEGQARYWWNLCDLSPDFMPFSYGSLGILGLRGLPSTTQSRENVAYGLVRLAKALNRRVSLALLDESDAESEFISVLDQTIRAYPSDDWLNIFGSLGTQPSSGRIRRWFAEVMRADPFVSTGDHTTQLGGGVTEADERNWIQRAKSISQRLASRRHVAYDSKSRSVLEDAHRLLSEQRRYANLTGDAYFLVRSLCNFANRVVSIDALQGSIWSAEALEWEPFNPYTWNTLSKTLMKRGEVETAIALLWSSIERFPHYSTCWNELATALRYQGAHHEAESVLLEAVTLFPTDRVGYAQLGHLYLASGDLDSAERFFAEGLEKAEGGIYLHNGLGKVYWRQNDLERAAAEFRKALGDDADSSSDQAIALLYLARLQHRFGDDEGAISLYRDALRRERGSRAAWLELAYLYRRTGKFSELEETAQSGLASLQDPDAQQQLEVLLREALSRRAATIGDLGQAGSSALNEDLIGEDGPDLIRSVEAAIAAAEAFVNEDDIVSAEELLRAARARHGDDRRLVVLSARLLLALGRDSDVLELLDQVSEVVAESGVMRQLRLRALSSQRFVLGRIETNVDAGDADLDGSVQERFSLGSEIADPPQAAMRSGDVHGPDLLQKDDPTSGLASEKVTTKELELSVGPIAAMSTDQEPWQDDLNALTRVVMSVDDWDLIAVRNQARLLRWRAARLGPEDGLEAESLRRRGLGLVEDMLRIRSDPLLAVERGLLRAGLGLYDAPPAPGRESELQDVVVPGVTTSLARELRQTVQGNGERYNESVLAVLRRPLENLRERFPALEGVVRVEDVRATFAVHDGRPLAMEQDQALRRLSVFTARSTTQASGLGEAAFRSWWSREVHRRVLGTFGEYELSAIPSIRDRVRENEGMLDELVDVAAARASAY